MRVIAVSQARYGVKHVVRNLLEQLAASDDVDPTYLTIPTHDAPSGVERVTLLDESWLCRFEDHRIPYLGYAVLNFWRRAYRYLSHHGDEYDAIWFHNPRLLPLLPAELHEKLLITYHTPLLSNVARHYDGVERIYYRLFGALERHGIQRATDVRYSVVSPAVVDELTALGVPGDAIRYIENGVDIDRFSPTNDTTDVRERYDLPADRPLLLFLGRLTGQKRPVCLVDVFDRVSRRLDGDVTLAVAGKGVRGEPARELARERGLENVHFLGFVPEETKPNLYAAADYFILPSAYEGSPLALYEALASGLPAIVSDLPGTRFVAEEDCGIVVDFENRDRAAGRIATYLDADTDHATNARRYAESELRWSVKAEEYRREFERVQNLQ